MFRMFLFRTTKFRIFGQKSRIESFNYRFATTEIESFKISVLTVKLEESTSTFSFFIDLDGKLLK